MTNMVDLYQKKYSILKRRCEELHKTNEGLLSRIHQVQKLLKKYQAQSRMFMGELEKDGEDFRGVEVPPMCETSSNGNNKETGESSGFSDTPSSLLTEQDPTTSVSTSDVITVEPDTSPPLMSPSTGAVTTTQEVSASR